MSDLFEHAMTERMKSQAPLAMRLTHFWARPSRRLTRRSRAGFCLPTGFTANLTQAQRDYFGAHTYRRVGREGSFHTQWEEQD